MKKKLIIVAFLFIFLCFITFLIYRTLIFVQKTPVSNIENKTITIDEIIKAVCTHFNIEADAIYTKSRKREVVQARQIAMFLAKNNTELSTAKIGAQIGGKDHATVLHACKTIKEQREVDKCLKEDVDKIQASLRK